MGGGRGGAKERGLRTRNRSKWKLKRLIGKEKVSGMETGGEGENVTAKKWLI